MPGRMCDIVRLKWGHTKSRGRKAWALLLDSLDRIDYSFECQQHILTYLRMRNFTIVYPVKMEYVTK